MARPAVGIQIVHLDELRRQLRKIADSDLSDEMVAANKELAKAIVDDALPNVPVLTGRLKRSVRGLGNKGGAVGKAGSAVVPYAAAIHWGRKNGGLIQSRPFLRDAAKNVEKDVADRYWKRVEKVFDAVNARS